MTPNINETVQTFIKNIQDANMGLKEKLIAAIVGEGGSDLKINEFPLGKEIETHTPFGTFFVCDIETCDRKAYGRFDGQSDINGKADDGWIELDDFSVDDLLEILSAMIYT